MKFRYDLVGSGWAECRVEFGGQAATLTASYLSDALESLCAAVVALLRGEPGARAAFEEEPGEYRWNFSRISQDRIRVRILELRESLPRQPDDAGRVVFDAETRLR